MSAISFGAISAGFHALLAADATLIAALAQYQGSPAIFTTSQAPPDAGFMRTGDPIQRWPYIVSNAVQTAERAGADLWRVERLVQVHAPLAGDPTYIDAVTDRLVELLDGTPLTVAGHDVVEPGQVVEIAGVSGPPDFQTDVRLVTFTILLEKTA